MPSKSKAPSDESASAAAPEAPAEAPEERVSIARSAIDAIKALLHASEWSASADAGGAKCPVCKASKPLDEANARDHERHTDECALGQAIAALP